MLCTFLINLLLIQIFPSVQASNAGKDSSGTSSSSTELVENRKSMENFSTVEKHLKYGEAAKKNEELNLTTRIVGGRKCTIEENPWMISIRKTRRLIHYCGGSLIAPRWVLSAAHCFENNFRFPFDVFAVIGYTTLRRSRLQKIGAKKIFMHSDYNRITVTDDIALVVLKQRVRMFLGPIALIKMPRTSHHSDLSKVCPSNRFTVAGWGSQEGWSINDHRPIQQNSNHLTCVELPLLTNEECQKYEEISISDKVICTLYPGGGKDSCQADSGGPLFCKGVQYGIVSWGRGCAEPDSPGFYTRVDKYLDFISDTMNNYRDSSDTFFEADTWFIIFVVSIITHLHI